MDVAVNVDGGMADRNARGQRITFTSLVMEGGPSEVGDGFSALLALALKDDDYGPYEPALRYLAQRVVAWDDEIGEGVEVPTRTAKVIESAKLLDRDLAGGMCPKR